SACAVVAWSLLHGGISLAPPDEDSPAPPPPPAVSAPQVPAAPPAAAVPALNTAEAALASIDVTVVRNDTLDRIFRRLKLNLADLASLRSLPGTRAALDSLRPGESLHFQHKDGELYGLERRLSDSETLKVSRDPDSGLKADVLTNALEMRMR